MSDRECLTDPYGEEDEERAAGGYVHPALRSYMYSPMGEYYATVTRLKSSVFVIILIMCC